MEFTYPPDDFDEVRNYMCLRLVTCDEVHQKEHGADTSSVELILETGELYDVIDFFSICSSVPELR